MTPSEVRQMLVNGLRRSMVGPQSPEDAGWLGANVEEKNPFDPDFKPEGFPTGPWRDDEGREVMSRDPILIYVIGVMYPIVGVEDRGGLDEESLVDAALDEPAVEVPDEQRAMDGARPEADDIDVESAAGGSQESFQGPRSLAFSVRVGGDSRTIRIRLRAARYAPKPSHGQTWWVREQIDESVELLPGGEQPLNLAGGIVVTLGATARGEDSRGELVTVWARNDSSTAGGVRTSERALFQVVLSSEFNILEEVGSSRSDRQDSLSLLYRNHRRLAAGHGCDVKVTQHSGGYLVETDTLPVVEIPPMTPDVEDGDGVPYGVGMRDLAGIAEGERAKSDIERLIRDYEKWIDNVAAVEVGAELAEVAASHVAACRKFLADVKAGWALVNQDSDVRRCLALASRAMADQRRAFGMPMRRTEWDKNTSRFVVHPRADHPTNAPSWRPFQIAFILSSLVKVVESRVAEGDESDVDVIWMPTGGGKTEAYLGLAAFTILWARSRSATLDSSAKSRAPSMKVLMRYTYRLLTVQQVSRAASLVCALEIIRREHEGGSGHFGKDEISIGAWLGGSVTPNTRDEAVKQFNAIRTGGDDRRFLLRKCPWCGTEMGEPAGKQVAGYTAAPLPQGGSRVLAHCPDAECEFRRRRTMVGDTEVDRGLPFYEVDEDIYGRPPDFVIATIDKVAQLAYRPDAFRLFGLKNGKRTSEPPRLFIQDELHLISGPLGSVDGVFEIALEHLCAMDGGARPLVVASTATTRNVDEQVKKLYGRSGRLVPPPGIDIDDSFFSRRLKNGIGKTYVGVCSTGSLKGLEVQVATIATLGFHAGILGPDRQELGIDPWWTNIAYFSSRRSLGMLASMIDTSLHSRIARLRAMSGRRSGRQPGDVDRADRQFHQVRELTATSSENVNDVFAALERGLPDQGVVDLCLATSMVEVGLDVGRLGLMTVIGQPKSSSSYIQVTGRVGRSDRGPGLVVAVLKATNARDLSHYEGFRAWHERLYASVESASVTPFTVRALERSLPSFMAILLRAKCAATEAHKVRDSLHRWEEVSGVLFDRIGADETSRRNAQRVLGDLHRLVSAESAKEFVWDRWVGTSPSYLMYPPEETINDERRKLPVWRVLNSMRSVEADSMLQVRGGVAQEGSSAPRPVQDGNGHDRNSEDEVF